MNIPTSKPEGDLYPKLRLLVLFRILFASILLGSTVILQLSEDAALSSKPLLILYGLIAGILILSLVYAVMLPRIRRVTLFAFVQIAVDTIVVTLIVFATGGYLSFFSFLYLVVIIYSSVLLNRRGSMVMAVVCGLQYSMMIGLEHYGILIPLGLEGHPLPLEYEWSRILYKVMFTVLACFAVAFLSGFLAEQTRRTRGELKDMEDHVKRVEKLASMGEMAAGLAHEIKNPLASLAGSIQILKEELSYSPENHKLMQIVLRETDRLNSLVSDFLLFAKPPQGNLEKVKLDRALEETLELFEKDSAYADRISIKRQLLPDIWVEMDPVHLRQVLWNLLLNASEAIEGGGTIIVTMSSHRARKVSIAVADTGVGIPEACLKNIYDPFFTTKTRGTGLGLSIVHRIIESYASRMDVESEPGIGTTFRFRLNRVYPKGA
ncbi:MAG: two-component sensor histidine kinase [Deltaproteobacteria bacterium]|nr:MAG: two-component sensor histidine kinase [Deltaproteobacteria bacterium]